MKPVNDFHKDVVLLHGQGDHVDSIGVLPLRYDYLNGGKVLVSCWHVSFKDILRMIWNRKIYLVVMGDRWPPLFIEADRAFTGIDEYTEMTKEGR